MVCTEFVQNASHNLTFMVKLKTVLDIRRTKSDGTYPIVIRITNYKEVKYYTIGLSAVKKQWDESTATLNKHHPNATSYQYITTIMVNNMN
jgi:hypothetical protein